MKAVPCRQNGTTGRVAAIGSPLRPYQLPRHGIKDLVNMFANGLSRQCPK